MDDLAYYIAIYYPHLLTEEERLAQRTLLGEAKVRSNARSVSIHGTMMHDRQQ